MFGRDKYRFSIILSAVMISCFRVANIQDGSYDGTTLYVSGTSPFLK